VPLDHLVGVHPIDQPTHPILRLPDPGTADQADRLRLELLDEIRIDLLRTFNEHLDVRPRQRPIEQPRRGGPEPLIERQRGRQHPLGRSQRDPGDHRHLTQHRLVVGTAPPAPSPHQRKDARPLEMEGRLRPM
jgi:hypothetical protein